MMDMERIRPPRLLHGHRPNGREVFHRAFSSCMSVSDHDLSKLHIRQVDLSVRLTHRKMAKRTETPQRVSISNHSLHDFIRERLRIGLDRTALVSSRTSIGKSQIY